MSVWVYVCQTRSLSYRGLRCLCGCMSVKHFLKYEWFCSVRSIISKFGALVLHIIVQKPVQLHFRIFIIYFY